MLYYLYVFMMYHNETVRRAAHAFAERWCGGAGERQEQGVKKVPGVKKKDGGSAVAVASDEPLPAGPKAGLEEVQEEDTRGGKTRRASLRAGTAEFKASILQILTRNKTVLEVAGLGLVTKLVGSVDEVFKKYDRDGSGAIDRAELRAVFEDLGAEATDATVEAAMAALDTRGSGAIDFADFTSWYTSCKVRVRTRLDVHARRAVSPHTLSHPISPYPLTSHPVSLAPPTTHLFSPHLTHAHSRTPQRALVWSRSA